MAKAVKEPPAQPVRTRHPDDAGFVTIGIKQYVFTQLEGAKDIMAQRMGGVRLSWTDFFKILLKKYESSRR